LKSQHPLDLKAATNDLVFQLSHRCELIERIAGGRYRIDKRRLRRYDSMELNVQEALAAALLISFQREAEVVFSSKAISGDADRRSRYVKELASTGLVEVVKPGAYQRPWRGQFRVKGRRYREEGAASLGRPPTYFRLNPELTERPFDRIARAGFDTHAKRGRLAKALVSTGLTRRIELALLRFEVSSASSEAFEMSIRRMFGEDHGSTSVAAAHRKRVAAIRAAFGSPDILELLLRREEAEFMNTMKDGMEHPTLLGLSNKIVLLLSILVPRPAQ
jgi:hypothetical protein